MSVLEGKDRTELFVEKMRAMMEAANLKKEGYSSIDPKHFGETLAVACLTALSTGHVLSGKFETPKDKEAFLKAFNEDAKDVFQYAITRLTNNIHEGFGATETARTPDAERKQLAPLMHLVSKIMRHISVTPDLDLIISNSLHLALMASSMKRFQPTRHLSAEELILQGELALQAAEVELKLALDQAIKVARDELGKETTTRTPTTDAPKGH